MEFTAEQIEEARRVQAGIDQVAAKIKAAVPSAGAGECGGLFDAYGSVEWKPSRPAGIDFSAWGDWEAWEHQRPMLGELVPSGDWVAWNSASGSPGQQIGFSDKEALSARQQAEMMAVICNAGAKTRVVAASGSFSASALRFRDIAPEVNRRVNALVGEGPPVGEGPVD